MSITIKSDFTRSIAVPPLNVTCASATLPFSTPSNIETSGTVVDVTKQVDSCRCCSGNELDKYQQVVLAKAQDGNFVDKQGMYYHSYALYPACLQQCTSV